MSNPSVMVYVPFALNGKKNTIQVTRQTNQDEEDATLTEGFPDVTMIKESVGGKAPKGLDFNGIFYLLSVDTVHRQSGQQIQYDATYATNIGGYKKGAILQSTSLTKSYISTVDNNTTDPDSTASSGWNVYALTPTATSTTLGTVKIADTLTSTATDTALTANQGNVLLNKMTGILLNRDLSKGYLWLTNEKGEQVILFQWGTVDYDSYPGEIQVDVTFNDPFPTNCFMVQATRKMIKHSSDGDAGVSVVGTPSKTGASFSLQNYNSSAVGDCRGFSWFAIGN